jgi:hypothetical protein
MMLGGPTCVFREDLFNLLSCCTVYRRIHPVVCRSLVDRLAQFINYTLR